MKIRRFLPLTLALAMLLGACGGTQSNVDTDSHGTDTETSGEPAETGYYDNIPEDASYNNYEFTVLSYDLGAWNIYITGDETIGDVLNNAAYRRNLEVEEMLDITISELLTNNLTYEDLFRQQVLAGDAEFDLCAHFSLGEFSGWIGDNLVYDWTEIPAIDLEAPWYNQSANEAYSIAGKQYFAVSDFTYTVQQHSRILFNKELFDKHQLTYPYEAVFNGEWTFDMMLEYCKDFYQDLNNDSVAGLEDQYGMATSPNFFCIYPESAGEQLARFEDDEMIFNLYSERIVNIIEDINEFYTNPDILMYGKGGNAQYKVFEEGRALFETYSSDPALLRNIEAFDFGYLPYPKYDDTQEIYYSHTYAGLMSIPNVEQDIERTGVIIEALSAASSKYLVDAFIESYIEGKILRDDESIEIYRMLRENAIYEMPVYIDPTGVVGGYFGTLIQPNAPEISSYYASIKELAETGYEKFFAAIGD